MNMNNGKMQVTTNAVDALKLVGCTYGLYSSYEDIRGCRVIYQEKPIPALVVQEDTSHHGSPYWESIKVLTEDRQKIEAYLQFRHLLSSIIHMELNMERLPKTEFKKDETMRGEYKPDENEQGQSLDEGLKMNL